MTYLTKTENNQEITTHYEVIAQGESIILHHDNGNSGANWKHLPIKIQIGIVKPYQK